MKQNTCNLLIIVFILFFEGCTPPDEESNKCIFNTEYHCDSIFIETYDFLIDEDSLIYSVPKKVPFCFKFCIDSAEILFKNRIYHPVIAGLNPDTIGLLNISEDHYYFKNTIYDDGALLFDFTAEENEKWKISNESYFHDYEVTLKNIRYDTLLKEDVYIFDFSYKGIKFPNGYYFEGFQVTKNHGIIRYYLDNNVECWRATS